MTPQPSIVCILGMHRSGTSLLTRLLTMLGIELGPDAHLLPADAYNPTGFWEHEPIKELNDELLARLGGSWRDVPHFPDGWENDAALEDLRERARRIVAEDFAGRAAWGFKDPRTCLTLPFWRALLPQMRFVLCVRNPADVAHSLEHTMPFEQGVALWLRYTEASLRHTMGEARAVVFYEDLLTDTAGELRRLATALGVEFPPDPPLEFARADLRHHRTSVGEFMDDPRASLAAKALYVVLRAESSSSGCGAPAADCICDALMAAEGSLTVAPQPPPPPRHPFAARMKELLEDEPSAVSQTISPHDGMHRADPEQYAAWGRMALRAIRQAMLAAGITGFRDILDLPCGYGRVLRHLKAAFPAASLTACDLEEEAVSFCAHTFDATPLVSRLAPSEIPFQKRFDLIWVGSLLTHLDRDRWDEFLAVFDAQLAPGGLLVFTTHGRWIAGLMRDGKLPTALPGDELPAMLAEFESGGFSYRDYVGRPGYGHSLSSPAWVLGKLQKFPRLRLVTAAERGWYFHQDVFGLVRTEPGK